MFDCAIQLMIEFIHLMPIGIVVIMVLNICRDLLFNK